MKLVSPAAKAKLAIDRASLECLVINREIFIPNREIFIILSKKSGDLLPNRETWKDIFVLFTSRHAVLVAWLNVSQTYQVCVGINRSGGEVETALSGPTDWILRYMKRNFTLYFQYPRGFIARFYGVSEHISPVMAWGFLGPDGPLKTLCHFFKVCKIIIFNYLQMLTILLNGLFHEISLQ